MRSPEEYAGTTFAIRLMERLYGVVNWQSINRMNAGEMEMSKCFHVFGDSIVVRGKALRTIVAATSRSGAAQALSEAGISVTVGHVALNWSPVSDHIELQIALSNPGTVFQQKTPQGSFVELETTRVLRPDSRYRIAAESPTAPPTARRQQAG